MDFYRKEVLRLHNELYDKAHLTERVIQAKHYIDTHYTEAIDLKAISAASHLSLFHFIRLFKRYYGTTPHRYLKELRIAKAKEHLRAGMSVSEACYLVGFDSLSSFTGLYKKLTGTLPKHQVRKKAILKKK